MNDSKTIKQQEDICFIITPIGDENSNIRRKTDGLIKNVIDPVCKKLNLKAIPAHKIDRSGSITNQVIKLILDSKLVIANLTGLNPNVMYELAIRHAVGLPIICLTEKSTELPFDITTERTIFYRDDMFGAIELIPELENKIKAALNDKEVDNPIYRVTKEKSIMKKIELIKDKEEQSSLRYIIKKLDTLEKRTFIPNVEPSSSKMIVNIRLKFEKPITSEHENMVRSVYNIIPNCIVAPFNYDIEDELFIYNFDPLDDIDKTILQLESMIKDTFNMTVIRSEVLRVN